MNDGGAEPDERVGDTCQRQLVVATTGATLRTLAALMAEAGTGWVVLVEPNSRVPTGVVTARAIVEQLARFGRHAVHAPARAAVEPLLTFAVEGESLAAVKRRMDHYGLSCVPVVDPRGALCGVVLADQDREKFPGRRGPLRAPPAPTAGPDPFAPVRGTPREGASPWRMR